VDALPKPAKQVVLAIAVVAGLSLLVGIQYYLGGPLRLPVTSEIHDMELSPDRSLIAVGAEDGTIRLWEVPDELSVNDLQDWPVRRLSGHQAPVLSVDFDTTGATLYSADQDGVIRQWDVASGEVLNVLESPEQEQLNYASLAADQLTLATIGDSGMIHVWDLPARGASAAGDGASGQIRQSIQSSEGADQAVALSADGSLLAAADGTNIQIWDARSGEPVQKLEGYWEDEETQEDWLGHQGEVIALAFSPNGTLLASGGADKIINFWELETGEVAWVGEGHFAAVTTVGFDSEGAVALSGSADAKAKTWRIPGGKSTGSYVGHLSTVNAVDTGPQPETVLSGGDDGTLRVWDTVLTSEIHTEWVEKGFVPQWGQLFGAWMLLSGVVGLVSVGGLAQGRRWGHFLALVLLVVGPIIVLGLPLLEAISYPFSLGTRLSITWPLLLLAIVYAALVTALMRERVATFYQASPSQPLAEQLVTSVRTQQLRKTLFIGAVWVLLLVILYSVLRRFDLDLAFMSHFLSFIMGGAGLTVLVSAASITLAVILALLGALGRLSKNPIANGLSGFYISLIRGTPLLVQIYIWYLGLPRLDIILTAVPAGILALGVNYGAYMTEIFRAGIQAIGKGQHEAAEALGMSRTQTLRRIVLPQAFRIVIPPIGNQFIAMMKDSSLVSVMGVWELTFRAAKIGRQYFRSIETFIVAAAFYWILTVVFQFFQGKLEEYMARGERR
jgi:polar amino acid transport system permease protein